MLVLWDAFAGLLTFSTITGFEQDSSYYAVSQQECFWSFAQAGPTHMLFLSPDDFHWHRFPKLNSSHWMLLTYWSLPPIIPREITQSPALGRGFRPLTWTSPGSAGIDLRPILVRRRRIRWCISPSYSSCHRISPGRRALTARRKTKHTPPDICGFPSDRSSKLASARIENV